ncbi:DUF1778 domain-containing protein [Salmonella enterica]|nr:DUF1778 domain-containing protein [Salmonella enterica]EEH2569650.1 DUF1778 domain-containing protein [Salmonella enterica]
MAWIVNHYIYRNDICVTHVVCLISRETRRIAQRLIMADPEAYPAFLTRLDQPPAPNAALRKTMQTPAPWEQNK